MPGWYFSLTSLLSQVRKVELQTLYSSVRQVIPEVWNPLLSCKA